ncbi:type IV secretory system conjugative DNA transfer family protein [Chondrinema litorale]|uniref:type IV secretory system conjugative DNA transfer family protein n=1 Tax=Chondrinema litorale TaxID=2994555 RepID=UPI0025428E40|nr:type IV secretory system conjugative DNA transfer family protein [Chondrinema litorale]UZS00074.1 type IV secretory system conjugative DNA transfer family protein [Chondrinema litorale]
MVLSAILEFLTEGLNGATASDFLLIFVGLILVAFGLDYYSIVYILEPTGGWEDHLKLFFLEYGKSLRLISSVIYVITMYWSISKSKGSLTIPISLFILCAIIFILSIYAFANIYRFASYAKYGYPLSFLGILLSSPFLCSFFTNKKDDRKIAERELMKTGESVNLKTELGWINIPNIFRGVLGIGGTGCGKSYSLVNPCIHQLIQKGFSGIVYDFKAFTLGKEMVRSIKKYDIKLPIHFIDFRDISRSHRCNPFNHKTLVQQAFAHDYALSIINNLDPETVKRQDFFVKSAKSWLAAIIWFYKKEYPEYCTIPHVINTALHHEHERVISMLETNSDCADMIRSISSAMIEGASKQIAGVIGSLQTMLPTINSPEICWVLGAKEGEEDFDLDINNPDNPQLLCIGSDPTLYQTFSPVISCMMTVASKIMNQQYKHKSFIILDEGPTLYIPGFDNIPATARSNKVAVFYFAQSISQIIYQYGRDKANVLLSVLNNQFFGKTSDNEVAELVSKMIGKEEKEFERKSISQGSSYAAGSSSLNKSKNISYSSDTRERFVINPQDVRRLKTGEFIGETVESSGHYFYDKISDPMKKFTKDQKQDYDIKDFAKFSSFVDYKDMETKIQENRERIKKEVNQTVSKYENIFENMREEQ